MPPEVEEKDVCFRDTYHSCLVHCLKLNPILQVSAIPGPLVILHDLYRMISSEWIAVNMYIERDLNTIEWRLEIDKQATLEAFESLLNKLFIMRRRITKYESLVNEQLQSCRSCCPISWRSSPASSNTSSNLIASTTSQMNCALSSDKVIYAIENDFKQVQQLIHRNTNRIMQSVALITSLMSVREGKTSIAQNQRFGFLTVLATLFLPFNTVATIVAIQTDYGPTGDNFWIFWAWLVGLASYSCYRSCFICLLPVSEQKSCLGYCSGKAAIGTFGLKSIPARIIMLAIFELFGQFLRAGVRIAVFFSSPSKDSPSAE